MAFTASDWLGRSAERKVLISSEMVDQFVAFSGDCGAIHVNDDFARRRGFDGGRLVHGMLLGALVSGLIGTTLPGDGGYEQQAQLSFRAPCYPGDEVTIRVTVVDFFESVQTLLLKVGITNAAGVVLATGQIQLGLRGD